MKTDKKIEEIKGRLFWAIEEILEYNPLSQRVASNLMPIIEEVWESRYDKGVEETTEYWLKEKDNTKVVDSFLNGVLVYRPNYGEYIREMRKLLNKVNPENLYLQERRKMNESTTS